MQSGEDNKIERGACGRRKPSATGALLCGALIAAMSLLSACSTKKNTAGSRFYQAMTTRYNVYFNGNEAYKAGVKAIDDGNKDNYLDILPFYPIGNKSTVGTGSDNFDRAIEKSQKAVTLHSIKRKPTRKQGKRYTKQYKNWLASREFNPFMHNVWMLMGKAQFQKGDFSAAAATFAYTARLYENRPDISAEARIWLARCYTQQEWLYDAEDVLRKVNNDSLPTKLAAAYRESNCHMLVEGKRYKEAMPLLTQTIKHERNKKRKARLNYLEGQLYTALGETEMANKAYSKTIKLSPPYELELNARVRQTELAAYSAGKPSVKPADKLHRMARNGKNTDMLDIIYYASGNIYLAAGDTSKAIADYRKGAEKSTRNGSDKGMLLLTLGDVYMARGEYKLAQEAYTQAIGLVGQSHKRYTEVNETTKTLDELVPHTEAVVLQDSLQRLARMDSVSRMVVIDTLIARFVAKEKEEMKKKKDAELSMSMMGDDAPSADISNMKQSSTISTIGNGDKSWYFYNSQTVEQGKTEFARTWGKRKLEDNWRRSNKSVVSSDILDEVDYSDEEKEADDDNNKETTDAGGNKPSGKKGKKGDGTEDGEKGAEDKSNDEHSPEFYLKQIPLTEEAMEESNNKLIDGLYNSGVIFKDKLEYFAESEKALKRIIDCYPEAEVADKAYYNYFLLLGQTGRTSEAETYRMLIISKFPESDYAKRLSDPDYARYAMYGKEIEDSLYVSTYQDYKDANYGNVQKNAEFSAEKFPAGKHRPKFMFLQAMSHLMTNQQSTFLDELKTLVRDYPENEITEIAGNILQGVHDGKSIIGGNLATGISIWGQRGDGSEDTDSISGAEAQPFKAERQARHIFVLAYPKGAIDSKRLLFEVARHNFSTFIVKEFDISTEEINGIERLTVTSFANMDEALYYQRRLYANPNVSEWLKNARSIIISEENYELLNKYYSFDDYDEFYRSNFGLPTAPGALDEEIEIDGGTLDDPINNLPEESEDDEDDGEEIEDSNSNDNGNKTIYIY